MKKVLLLLAALAASSLPGFSAFTEFYRNINYCGTSVSSCQVGITPTSGHLLVVVAMYSNTAPTISGVTGMTGGGTWTRPASCKVSAASGGQTIDMMYNLSAGTVSSGLLTVNFSAAVGFADLYVYEFTGGTAPYAFDACAIANGTTSTVNGGSITTTGASDLALAVTTQSANAAGVTPISSAPWPTTGFFVNGQELSAEALGGFGAQTTQFSYTVSSAVTSAGSTIAFKDATAGGGGGGGGKRFKRVNIVWKLSDGVGTGGSTGGGGGGGGTTDFLAQAIADQYSNNTGSTQATNEGHPHGVPSNWDFYAGAFTGDGNNPCNSVTPCNTTMAMTLWGVVYADSTGNPATNTRVEVKACKSYWYSTTTQTWTFNGAFNTPEFGDYPEDYSAGETTSNTRTESDGGISVKPASGKVSHFYAPFPRMTFPRAQFGGIVNVCQARLVVDNAGSTDDRASAKLLVGVGGDFYPSASGAGINNNPGIGGGKMKYVTTAWRSFAMSTLSYNAINALPSQPPIDLTGLNP